MFIRKVSIVAFIFLTLDSCKLADLAKWDRKEHLQKAKVWHKTDIARMNILAGPQNEISCPPEQEITCEYVEPKDRAKGFSPKFKCKIRGIHEVRVKYNSREILSEIAGTRLLWALGFYTDEVYPVKLKCVGCPAKNPSQPSDDEPRVTLMIDEAIIERNFRGAEIGLYRDQGWSWDELDQVDVEFGGASKAEIDALKLLAVFLQHTDSKPQQQRLGCYSKDLDRSSFRNICKQPILMLQDVGATFGMGANKVESYSSMYLRGWENQPIWNQELEQAQLQKTGTNSCFGNLIPSKGGDLRNPQISEEGRKFLSDLLQQLSDQQISNLFRVARAERTDETILKENKEVRVTVADWVRVFEKKRQEISERQCN